MVSPCLTGEDGKSGGALTLLAAASMAIVKLVPWDSFLSWRTDRRNRRSDFVAQRIGPVEQFSQLLFEFHDRLTGILEMWGPEAPYDERTRERAMDLYYTRRRELAKSGIAAREAARRIDPELDRRVQALETESANLVSRLEYSPTVGSSHNFPLNPIRMGFFIERNDRALVLQQAVAGRIRELLS